MNIVRREKLIICKPGVNFATKRKLPLTVFSGTARVDPPYARTSLRCNASSVCPLVSG